jgi:ABC-2 type transport system permease protein
MNYRIIKLFAAQTRAEILRNRSTIWLMGICNVLLIFALIVGHKNLRFQQNLVKEYSHDVRERWENNPDKHPHRMAHYGYLAFRDKHPLSFFDYGLDAFVGNTVFLEAHRQNTVNFSKASLSTGLLRFGELSAATILQILLPLLLLFWGFGLVAQERENGTLKIILAQGVSWQDLLWGKILGLFSLSLGSSLPAMIISFIFLIINDLSFENFTRFLGIFLIYHIYLLLISGVAVWGSASSQKSKTALVKLIGFWLLMILVLPKVAQVVSQSVYPSPSKIEFDTAVESEIVKQGDSHNPNDLHYKAIKDSLLVAYGVDSTHKLPFNYSGYIMREGERLSAQTFNEHQKSLVQGYQNQQNLVKITALFSPFLAVKNLSMALTGTDFGTYNDFQNQAENYRYNLAQTMNELQIKYISNKAKNSADKKAIISKKHWEELPPFEYRFLGLFTALKQEIFSILSIVFWLLGFVYVVKYHAKNLKVF